MTKNKEDKKNTKEKESIIEEINLDEIDMEELGFSPEEHSCTGCPMNCHNNIKEADNNKKKK